MLKKRLHCKGNCCCRKNALSKSPNMILLLSLIAAACATTPPFYRFRFGGGNNGGNFDGSGGFSGKKADCLVKYSEWSPCSEPCGPGGFQRRYGEIIQQAKGGKPCGPLRQERPCVNNQNCLPPDPVDCQVWFGDWSECSKICGGGTQYRRGLIEVEPKNGGKPCGILDQQQSCNLQECDQPPIDCQVWFGDWSQCSASCNGGYQWRRGVVEQEAQNGGKPCEKLEQEQACSQFNCDEPNVDCKVVYPDWSACSKPCGGGYRWRRGTIITPQQGSGRPCPRKLEQEEPCNGHSCTTAPINCKVTYTDYTECSRPCGGGKKQKWGSVVISQENGGAPCPPLEVVENCNEHLCDIPVIDCEVKFSEWSVCTRTCGGGSQSRWGRVIRKNANGGVPCPDLEQRQTCNKQPCLEVVDCKLWFPEWSACSASCGGGYKWRRGLVEREPKNGGKPCGKIEQEQSCNNFECDLPRRDCRVEYSEWSECTQACGGGQQWRRGTIVQEQVGAGKPCPPSYQLEQEQACNTFECTPSEPVDCIIKYSEWTQCTASCGGGEQQQWGSIIRKAANGGKPCTQRERKRKCNEGLCDVPVVDCEVRFTEYGPCSATCGGGYQQKWGEVIVEPENGGAPCPKLEQQRPCNTDINCAPPTVDCIVRYTQWSPCSKLCGSGTRERWGKVIEQGTPGGAPCGPLEQSEKCNQNPCSPKFFYGK